MDSLVVIATDLALFIHMDLAVAKCVLVKMMLIVTLQMVPVSALRGGWVRTAPFLARKASMAKTASTAAVVKMVQSVIPHQANVIVLQAGAEYFVTLNVPPDDLERIVRRNVIARMGLLVTI